jgi:hypothetical protein
VYPGVGGVSGKLLRNTSSAGLKVVKVVRDLMLGGTTLYRADAREAKELNLRVLMLLCLELPSGLIQVVPCLEVSRKMRLTLFAHGWQGSTFVLGVAHFSLKEAVPLGHCSVLYTLFRY